MMTFIGLRNSYLQHMLYYVSLIIIIRLKILTIISFLINVAKYNVNNNDIVKNK